MKRRNLLTKIVSILSLILAFIFVGVVFAAPVTIDTFNEAAQALTANPTTPSVNGVADDVSILGDERDAVVNLTSGLGVVNLAIDGFGSNLLSFSQDSGITGNATVTWDGDDNDATTLAENGLPAVDLISSSPANTGFLLTVVSSDLGLNLILRVYADTAGSNFSTRTVALPGGITGGSRVDFIIPFSGFTTGGGTGADFANVGAVQMAINSSSVAEADVSIDLFEASSFREFGDLPTSFSTAILDASHIPQGLRLGANLDTESAHQPNGPATGDDSASTPDDEDGVVRSDPNWNDGNGDVTVTVNGCTGTCYVNGWMEFGNGTNSTLDFDFTDANEYIIQDFAVTANGAQNTPSFTIPTYADMTSNSVYARFRVCPTINTCDTPTAVDVTNGEIEDYLWEFGPTAITLQNATAENPQNNMVLALVLGMVGLGITSLILHKKQRATGN